MDDLIAGLFGVLCLLAIVIVPVLFVGLFVWLTVRQLRGPVSWDTLADRYTWSGPWDWPSWPRQTAHLGSTWFRSCLTVGANADGLYLHFSDLFSLGRRQRPPLFIPWSAIRLRVGSDLRFLGDVAMFDILTCDITLTVYATLGREVADAAGLAMPARY